MTIVEAMKKSRLIRRKHMHGWFDVDACTFTAEEIKADDWEAKSTPISVKITWATQKKDTLVTYPKAKEFFNWLDLEGKTGTLTFVED